MLYKRLCLVHEGSKPKVFLGDSSGVVGTQSYINSVVDVEPLRVVVALLSNFSHETHELPSLVEVSKVKSFGYGGSVLFQLPSRDCFAEFFEFVLGECCCEPSEHNNVRVSERT